MQTTIYYFVCYINIVGQLLFTDVSAADWRYQIHDNNWPNFTRAVSAFLRVRNPCKKNRSLKICAFFILTYPLCCLVYVSDHLFFGV